jgi:hypothetical protein
MLKHHVSTRFALLTLAGTTLVIAFAIGMRWMRPKAVTPSTSAAPAPPTSQAGPDIAYLEGAFAELRGKNLRLGARSDEIVDILAELEARLGELEARPSPGWEASGAPASAVAPETEALDPETERRAREQFDKTIQTEFDLLGKHLKNEEVDAPWSAMAQRDIAYAVGGMADRGLALADAECGSTYCRIELAINPELPEAEVLRAVQEIEPWSGETLYRVGTGENAGATVYLAREGHRLAHFELEDEAG